MKMKMVLFISVLVIMGLLFQPGCKTAESWVFNIVGTWSFNINTTMSWNPTFNEVLTFVGSASSGTVNGWSYDPGEIGSYTVTGVSVSVVYNYLCPCGSDVNWTFSATASQSNENYLSGTGQGHHLPGGTWTLNWSAVRL
jgi:hypothetical protein